MPINRRQLIGLFATVALLPGTKAWGDGGRRRRRGREGDDHDYENAYDARRSGDILPLRDILTNVRAIYPGEIVGVEFEREDGLQVYELKILQTDGRYLEIYVDARTGAVLKVEGK